MDIEEGSSEVEENVKNINLLPATSRIKYDKAYSHFKHWQQSKQKSSFSETEFLSYFGEIAKAYKASTLWSFYSMLKSTVASHDNIDISRYTKLRTYLKRLSERYTPKKTKSLTTQEIQTFLSEAPDSEYLLTKVGLIVGITGACKREELCKLRIENIEDLKSVYLIKIPDTKTKTTRSFTISGNFYNLLAKYAALRPKNVTDNRFFVNYQYGRCTNQVVGINKFGNMAKQVATFLKLPEPNQYTGHCFRRSSATILFDTDADITTSKRNGGLKSTTIAEELNDSLNNKIEISNQIVNSIQKTNALSTSTTTHIPIFSETSIIENKPNELSSYVLNNCSNLVFNITNNYYK